MPKSLVVRADAGSTRSMSGDELSILKAATEMIGVGIVAVDAVMDDQPIIYANQGFEALTGYSSEQILGRNCRFLQGPETDSRRVREIRTAIERGNPFHGKILNYRKDGSRFWNDLHIMPLRDSDGRITHFAGVQTDVTEQTLSSQRLAEMLEVERVISSTSRLLTRRPGLSHRQNLDDALALIAKKLKLDRVVILEFSDEEAVPRITHSYASGDLRAIPTPIEQNFPWYVDQLRHKRKVVIASLESLPSEAKLERLYAEKTGLRSHCAVPVIVGDIVLGSLSLSNYNKSREWPDHVLQRLELLCEIIGNTLARERGHNALVESEALMRSMADALPVCISFVDAQSRYRFNNVTYEQWFGVSRSELAGKKMERVLGKQAYQTVKRYVERVLSGVATHFEAEVPYLAAGKRHVEVDYVPHFGREAGVLGFFAFIQDVTDRRRADAESQRLRDQLAHVSRVASMGELTATVAHELNQPLSAILSNAQAALRELSREDPRLDGVRSALTDIVADDKRAGEVIRRIKSFLRQTDEERETADINKIIEEVINLIHSEAQIRKVKIKARYSERLPHVCVDRVQIQQVILNLLINALDAVAKAGRQKLVDVETELCGRSSVMVSVHDNGPGISSDQVSRIFEPFYSTKAAGGLGMGLAISRAIAEAHGGELTVVESDRAGATLRLKLPIASEGR